MKKLASFVFTVLIVATIAGGGAYYLLDQKSAESKTELQKQIDDLKMKLIPRENEANVEDDTANWKSLTDDKTGFSLKYPEEIILSSESKDKNEKRFTLLLEANKISELKGPAGYDTNTANKDLLALKKGDPNTQIGWGTSESFKIVTLPGAFAKEFITLSSLETCNVQLNRTALIYKEDYQVKIQFSYNDLDKLKSSNASYFQTDSANCGTEKKWKDSNDFYKDLSGGKTDESSQTWYRIFDKMLATATFASKQSDTAAAQTEAAGNEQEESTPTSAVDSAATANWTSFSNKTLKISLKHPTNWKSSAGADYVSFTNSEKSYKPKDTVIKPVIIYVYKDDYSSSVDKYIADLKLASYAKKTGAGKIGGKTSYKIKVEAPSTTQEIEIVFANGNVYHFQNQANEAAGSNKEDYSYITDTFGKILSTVEFTK